MPSVCSWDDVAYGMYNTDVCVVSDYEYIRDMYANSIDFFLSNTTSCEETIICVLGTYMIFFFLCCVIKTKIPQKYFCGWWHMFNAFVSTCVVSFCKTHVKIKHLGLILNFSY